MAHPARDVAQLGVLEDAGAELGVACRGLASRLPWRVRCDLQQLTFSQRRPNATAAPGPGFGELPECLACVLMALSAASERLVRLIELRAQLRDGSAQEFELGALLVAQFDAPIPSLIGLSHQPVFAVPRRPPARRAPGIAGGAGTPGGRALCMEGDSESVAAAFRGCRGEAGADHAPADAVGLVRGGRATLTLRTLAFTWNRERPRRGP